MQIWRFVGRRRGKFCDFCRPLGRSLSKIFHEYAGRKHILALFLKYIHPDLHSIVFKISLKHKKALFLKLTNQNNTQLFLKWTKNTTSKLCSDFKSYNKKTPSFRRFFQYSQFCLSLQNIWCEVYQNQNQCK